MNNDFQNSVLKLIDLTLQCRPADPWEFASIFFVDEQSADNKLAHALHCLPFVLNHDPVKFREYASTLFCTEYRETLSKSDPPAAIGEIGTEHVHKILNSLLSNRKYLIATLSPYFPTSECMGFAEFEHILKSFITVSQYCDRQQLLVDAFSQQCPDGNVDSYIQFLKTQGSAQDGTWLEHDLLLSIQGAESYRSEHSQYTPLWPRLCQTYSAQLLVQQWRDGGEFSPWKVSV